MAKRKGPSTSRPRGRKKAAKEGRDAKTSEGGGVEDECDQLRREFYSLEEKRAKLLEKEHKLEVQRPKLDAQRRKLEEQEHELADEKRELEEEKRKLEEPLPPLRSEVEQLSRACFQRVTFSKSCAARGRFRMPSVWTSSRRRCGRRSSTTSKRTTSFPWL